MVFFGNLIFSLLYAYAVNVYVARYKITTGAYFLLLSPMFLIWLIISGGQYDVGTDYFSYFALFQGEGLERYEPLFVSVIRLFNSINISGQALFFIFYGINFFFLFLILKRVEFRRLYFLILLYIVVIGLFNNQLNVLRQSVSLYIGTFAVIQYYENKKKTSFLWLLCSFLIHKSSMVFLLLYIKKPVLFSKKTLFILTIIAVVLSVVLSLDMLTFLLPYLPAEYAWHIKGGLATEREILTKITKYIFIPLYLLALNSYEKFGLNNLQMALFKWGYVTFCMRISLIGLTVVSRLTDTFLLFSIFPLYFYFCDLQNRKKHLLITSFVGGLIIFYMLKTIVFPKAEYLYQSIYF